MVQSEELTIQSNCLYLLTDNQWCEVDVIAVDKCKLNLWSSFNLFEQVALFAVMCQKTSFSFTFQLCEQEKQVYWEVFADLQTLKSFVQQLVIDSYFDYLIWPEVVNYPRLIVFDMDSTFIEIEVIDELARLHGVENQVSAITESAMCGEIDFAGSLIERVACLKGLHESAIKQVISQLPISKGIDLLVDKAKNYHCQIAIVSGGFMPFVQHLKDNMALYAVQANQLEIVQGQLTGKVQGQIVDAEEKAKFLLRLCDELEITPKQVLAVGDGANDLRMMSVAGLSLAYRAKPKVQAKASGRINSTHFGHLVELFGWNKTIEPS